MGSTRTLRTATVTAVIAWKLVVLALLPAAFCCQAVLDGGGRPCCEGKDHGDFCPLKPTRSAAPDGPRMQTCDSFDSALIGLLSLTGVVRGTARAGCERPAARGRPPRRPVPPHASLAAAARLTPP